MDLVVGINCYFDVEEANKMVTTRFISTDPVRKLWEQLTEEDKKVIILNSTEKYDNSSMLYKGYKAVISQPLQFPRIDAFNNVWNCPDKIKLGLLLQGLRDVSTSNSELEQMYELGIHSFSDGGGASVTFESNRKTNRKIKNSLGISRDLWTTYFSEYSFLI
jgi:hypothetical protein